MMLINTHQNTGGALLTGCMFKPDFTPEGDLGGYSVACGELDAPDRMPSGQVLVHYSTYNDRLFLALATSWRE